MRSVGSVTGAYTHKAKLNWHANNYTETCAQRGSVTGAYTYGPKLSWKANIDTDTCDQGAA